MPYKVRYLEYRLGGITVAPDSHIATIAPVSPGCEAPRRSSTAEPLALAEPRQNRKARPRPCKCGPGAPPASGALGGSRAIEMPLA